MAIQSENGETKKKEDVPQDLPQETVPMLLPSTDLSTPCTPIPGRAIPLHGSVTTLLPSGTSTPLLDYKGSDSVSIILPCGLNVETKSMLSETNSSLFPICRICHMPEDESDMLISPCRCAGTLQFIHGACLMVS